MSDEPKFPHGIFYNEPHENAPDFVIGGLGFNVQDACRWLQEHADHDGRVKLDIKRSKGGKVYMALNEWKPTGNRADQPKDYPVDEPYSPEGKGDFDSDIPF